jgi:hypothetical protein
MRKYSRSTVLFFLLTGASIGAAPLAKDYAAALWGAGMLFFAAAVASVVRRADKQQAHNSPS